MAKTFFLLGEIVKWLFKIVISDLTRNYDDNENKINGIAQVVVERIRQSDAYQRFPQSLDVILERMKTAKTEAQFNHALDALYDFGDAHAIWIENFP